MPLLLLLIVLFFPRLGAVLLALLTDWFITAGVGLLALILGIIFAPVTLLWYSVVQNYFAGQWGLLQILVLVLALMADFGGSYGGWYRWHPVERHVEPEHHV